jgi:DNA-binding LytR/AlgR family response regulator
MNCVVVDDDKLSRMACIQLFSEFSFLKIVSECNSTFELMEVMSHTAVDLVLLDIEMPKMSGLDFLKSNTNHPLVILMSAKKDYAIESYEYNVVDYLLKPLEIKRFSKAIHKAWEVFQSKAKTIDFDHQNAVFIKEKGVLNKVLIDEILYVNALGDYISIFLKEKRYIVHMNLKEFEARLNTTKFIRIHRSYVVALHKLSAIEENTAFINEIPIPIGDVYKSDLLKKINFL